MPDAPTRRIRGAGGVDIATYHLGGDGPPLLLLHASGFHGRCWTPVVPALTPWFSVWAIDQRGHGRSGKSIGYDDWRAFRDDALAVIDALGEGPFSAVGHSLGGAVALLAEQHRPGAFAQLYCYEPVVVPPGMPLDGARLATIARKRQASFASRAAAYSNYSKKPPFSRFDPAALGAYVDYGFVDARDGTVTLACSREDEASMYEGAEGHAAFQRLPDVRAPVTLARGGTSTMPPELQRTLAAELRYVRTEAFEDLGHFGPMEKPLLVGHSIARAFSVG